MAHVNRFLVKCAVCSMTHEARHCKKWLPKPQHAESKIFNIKESNTERRRSYILLGYRNMT